ncbi:MAG: hypothetical protein GZ089_01175 [Aromatoleum sp.]|nr:hypothetical protein [Aromatoleum sp.]
MALVARKHDELDKAATHLKLTFGAEALLLVRAASEPAFALELIDRIATLDHRASAGTVSFGVPAPDSPLRTAVTVLAVPEATAPAVGPARTGSPAVPQRLGTASAHCRAGRRVKT